MTVPTNASAGNPLFEEHEGHLKRALGLPALVFFGLVYMVPLTVFTTYGIVTETTGGRLPVAYVVTLIAMFFTALSYAWMAIASAEVKLGHLSEASRAVDKAEVAVQQIPFRVQRMVDLAKLATGVPLLMASPGGRIPAVSVKRRQ